MHRLCLSVTGPMCGQAHTPPESSHTASHLQVLNQTGTHSAHDSGVTCLRLILNRSCMSVKGLNGCSHHCLAQWTDKLLDGLWDAQTNSLMDMMQVLICMATLLCTLSCWVGPVACYVVQTPPQQQMRHCADVCGKEGKRWRCQPWWLICSTIRTDTFLHRPFSML